jgi:hypothetical protein
MSVNVPNVVMECLQCGWQDKVYQSENCPNCRVMLASLFYSPDNQCNECRIAKLPHKQIFQMSDPETGNLILNAAAVQQWVEGPEYQSKGGEALPIPPGLVQDFLRVNVTEPRHYPHVKDPEQPGLMVQVEYTTGDVSHMLIDGSHRAAMKVRDRKTFYAHILPWQWAKRFVMSYQPGRRYKARP